MIVIFNFIWIFCSKSCPSRVTSQVNLILRVNVGLFYVFSSLISPSPSPLFLQRFPHHSHSLNWILKIWCMPFWFSLFSYVLLRYFLTSRKNPRQRRKMSFSALSVCCGNREIFVVISIILGFMALVKRDGSKRISMGKKVRDKPEFYGRRYGKIRSGRWGRR